MGLLARGLTRWSPDRETFTAPLRVKKPIKLQLDHFPRGLNNQQIDVLLSPGFIKAARQLIRRMLRHEVMESSWGEQASPPDRSDLEVFRNAYASMMEYGVDQARRRGQLASVQLLQLSVIKYLLQQLDIELTLLRARLQGDRSSNPGASNGESMQLHARFVRFAQREMDVRGRLTRRLFRELQTIETTRLSKLRKSALGRSWALPKQLLFNPMLQTPSLWAEEQMLEHYSLVCNDPEGSHGFAEINRLLLSCFTDFLPGWALPLARQAPAEGRSANLAMQALRNCREEGELHGLVESRLMLNTALQTREFDEPQFCWLDTPENIDRIIYSVKPSGTLSLDHCAVPLRNRWSDPGWPAFHRRLLKRVLRMFRQSGLERAVLAAHFAPLLFRELNRQVPVRLIYHYLAGIRPKAELQRKLASQCKGVDMKALTRLLEQTVRAISRLSPPQRRRRVFSFIRHFCGFRRDLKLAYTAHRAMASINLLTREEDIEVSRRNGSLQELLQRSEVTQERQAIRNHVIIKADVRGSTRMTRELRERNLNPAFHFSRNLFEPITGLLKQFAASKVFIEGDAVILSIFEYQESAYQWLCVAHACGLAQQILQVVERQNVANRKQGLPELELGLGIAFSDEAPTFLQDEGRPIMISSAINRADQLSSCSAALRSSAYGQGLGAAVQVLAPPSLESVNKMTSDKLLRYNVNGIELDVPAFYKLRQELKLTPWQPQLAEVAEGRYLVGRYPDLDGVMHQLVIREAPVRDWDGQQAGEREALARYFYQVVTDPLLLAALQSAKPERAVPERPSAESATGSHYLH